MGVRRSTTSCCTMSRLPSPSTRSTLRAITPRWWPTSTCHSRDLGTPPTDRAREGGAHDGHCRDRAARHGVGRDHDTKTPHIPLFSDTPTAGGATWWLVGLITRRSQTATAPLLTYFVSPHWVPWYNARRYWQRAAKETPR